jgi:type VI secretion system protein ImpA
VAKAIERICDFYARTEPSSPVPILLKRAKRLVGKSFEELLQDLAPGGLRQLQVFSGDGTGEE